MKTKVGEFPYSEKFAQNLPSVLTEEGNLLEVTVKAKPLRLLMHLQGPLVWSSFLVHPKKRKLMKLNL